MPLKGENFRRDNKLVHTMLKAKSKTWTWIQDCCNRTANGRKAWLASVEHFDGSGKLSKCVKQAKEEIARHHYKDKGVVFPFEKYGTKLKENFYVLEKDKSESLPVSSVWMSCLAVFGQPANTGIVSAKVKILQNYRRCFAKAADCKHTCLRNLTMPINMQAVTNKGM